jgi:U3 small nucleolar ribonucleoprotein component
MRIKNIKNVTIDTEFEGVGAGVEPLTDEQYDTLEKIVKRTKTPTAVHDFDDKSKWFLVKIPESKNAEERVMNDGTTMLSLAFILPGDKWTNILMPEDAEEVDAWESHKGCKAAIVGNLVESKDGQFVNIRGYRGMIILANEVEDNDDLDI